MKILAWMDSPLVSTGFGTVSKHVLRALHDAGHEIELIGINHLDTWYDQTKHPYKIHSPLTLFGFNGDQMGTTLMIKHIQKGNYDAIFTLNDRGILNDIVPTIREQRKKKNFKWVVYLPYDLTFIVEPKANIHDCLREADEIVLFHEDACELYGNALPDLKDKLKFIHHGVNTKDFYKITPSERKEARDSMFEATEDDFIIINVNRNQPRKDISRTIYIFNEFRKRHSNAKLFLNCKPSDMGGDIRLQSLTLGIQPDQFYTNPENFSENKGHSIETLRAIYNSGDVFLTTDLGEGWGLCRTEAMACGTPIIVPDHTSGKTQVGDNEERGYLCKSRTTSSEWVVRNEENNYRPLVNVESALECLEKVYQARTDQKLKTELRHKLKNAKEWIEQNTWDKVCKQWVKLFSNL